MIQNTEWSNLKFCCCCSDNNTSQSLSYGGSSSAFSSPPPPPPQQSSSQGPPPLLIHLLGHILTHHHHISKNFIRYFHISRVIANVSDSAISQWVTQTATHGAKYTLYFNRAIFGTFTESAGSLSTFPHREIILKQVTI